MLDDDYLWTASPTKITSRLLNKVMKDVAIRHHLDPHRLTPHSLRVAGPVQLVNQSDARQQQQGNWSTVQGLTAYARGTLDHAAAVTADLHNPSIVSLQMLQLSYGLPSALPRAIAGAPELGVL
jgi:hypothetical protein